MKFVLGMLAGAVVVGLGVVVVVQTLDILDANGTLQRLFDAATGEMG